MRGKILFTLSLLILCCPFVLLAADPEISWEKTSIGWEATVIYSSSIGSGGVISVDDFIGDMIFSGGESKKAEVMAVYSFDTRKEDEAKENLDRILATFKEKNNELIIKAPKKKARWFSWDRYDLHRVVMEVSIPEKFEIFASTSGGDVEVSKVEGRTEVSTSGGDIICRNLKGEVDVSTSGGNVEIEDIVGEVDASTSGGDVIVENVKGDTDVSTSGGNIEITEVEGELEGSTSGGNVHASKVKSPEAMLSTSGGNIQVSKFFIDGFCDLSTSGGNIKMMDTSGDIEASTSGGKIRTMVHEGDLDLTTSAGDIIADEVTGAIQASTSVGNLSVVHLGFGESRNPKIELESHMGNVKLTIPDDTKADILAEINSPGGDFRSDFDLDVHYSRYSHEVTVDDVLNGGGAAINIITTGGDIILKKL